MADGFLDNARKVLAAERRQGCRDTTVVGGLGRYLANWRARVAANADDPSSLLFAERIVATLEGYAAAPPDVRAERLDRALALLEVDGGPTAPTRPVTPAPAPVPVPNSGAVRGGPTPGVGAPRSGEPRGTEQPLSSTGAAPHVEHSEPPSLPPPMVKKPPESAPPPDTPIGQVKGIKPKEAQLLGKLGIARFGDLLWHFPSRHQVYPPARPMADRFMQPVASVVGRVVDVEVSATPRGGLHKIVATLADGTGRVTATWFRHGRFSPVKPGQVIAVSGKVAAFGRALNFESPDWERAEAGEPVHTRRLVPTYPLTAGLADRWLREKVKWAVDAWAEGVADPLPAWLRAEHDLLPLGPAIRRAHFPEDEAALMLARRRLAFDELFTIQLVVIRRKLEWHGAVAPVLLAAEGPLSALLDAQPYRLTVGLRRGLYEVVRD